MARTYSEVRPRGRKSVTAGPDQVVDGVVELLLHRRARSEEHTSELQSH